MSVRRVKINGRRVWQARTAYKGLRKSTIRDTKEEAREAEAELLRELQGQHARAAQGQQAPATLKLLLEAYAADLVERGKGDETVSRVEYTGRAIEALLPEL